LRRRWRDARKKGQSDDANGQGQLFGLYHGVLPECDCDVIAVRFGLPPELWVLPMITYILLIAHCELLTT
jgi:hypothetical protein